MKCEDLIEWRQQRKLTQEQLGQLLGVTKACISRWETGDRNIPAFLHLALDCLKVKREGEEKLKGNTEKKRKGG
jgi:transcriptional regulator with XRE-family HTH domain